MDDMGFGEEEVHSAPVEGNVERLPTRPTTTLNDVLEQYDPVIVSTEPGREFIVVAPKGEHGQRELALQDRGLPFENRRPNKPRAGIGADSGEVRPHDEVDIAHGVGVAGDEDSMSEMGSAVASPWTSWTRREYNPDLFGLKGLQIYDKMRRSDGTVRGTLRLAKTPVLAADWGIKPATQKKRDQNISNFVWNNLTNWMSMSWAQFVSESMLMMDFGYYMFEKVFAHGEDQTNDPQAKGKIVWKKFAPRHPMDVKEWFYDINGGPLSVDMWAPPSVGVSNFEGGVIQVMQHWVNIPINKLLVFTFDKEAGNIEGISILRSAYKHWFYKDNLYKIDAIQKERHGIGIPVIQLPIGYGPEDKSLADQLGRNLRTNDRAHVVLPPQWVLTFAEVGKLLTDCLPSIKHHDDMIPQNILGAFLNHQQSGAGAEQQHTIFLKASRFVADVVIDVMNKYAIPQLVQYNWNKAVYPTIFAKRIGEQEDWRTESFTIRNYVGAGVIVPDDPMENMLRDRLGLPPTDLATARMVRHTPVENEQMLNPQPFELPGGHGQLSPELDIKTQQKPNSGSQLPPDTIDKPPKAPTPSLPRQTKPGATPPSVGRGDKSGTSGRRGQ